MITVKSKYNSAVDANQFTYRLLNENVSKSNYYAMLSPIEFMKTKDVKGWKDAIYITNLGVVSDQKTQKLKKFYVQISAIESLRFDNWDLNQAKAINQNEIDRARKAVSWLLDDDFNINHVAPLRNGGIQVEIILKNLKFIEIEFNPTQFPILLIFDEDDNLLDEFPIEFSRQTLINVLRKIEQL